MDLERVRANAIPDAPKVLTVRVTVGGRLQDFAVSGRRIIRTEVGEVLVDEAGGGYDLLLPAGAYVDLLEWRSGQSASEAQVLASFRSDEHRGLVEVRGRIVTVARLDGGIVIGVNWV